MYHLIALLIGFFIDLLLGDPHSIPHPVVWIGKLISAAEKLVRRLFPKTVRGENIAGGGRPYRKSRAERRRARERASAR